VLQKLADPLGTLEVGEHEDVEELGAGSGTSAFRRSRIRRSSSSGLMAPRLRRRTVARVLTCLSIYIHEPWPKPEVPVP
jgi:hypothetical protein